MIYIVSGSQRTGTSLMMNIFGDLGFNLIGKKFPFEKLSEYNPEGFFDSGKIFEDEERIKEALIEKVIKIFPYQFRKYQVISDIFEESDYLMIITLRHPLASISSHFTIQDAKKEEGLSSGMSLTRCIREYNNNYDFLQTNFISKDENILIVSYEKYDQDLDSQSERICSFIFGKELPDMIRRIKTRYRDELNGSSRPSFKKSIKVKIEAHSEYQKSLDLYKTLLTIC